MDSWMNFIFELGVLCFFGFLYYFFQKRRIIRVDTEEIFFQINEIIYDLNNYLDGKESEESYQKLNNLTKDLEKILDNTNIEDVIKFTLGNDFDYVPSDIKKKLLDIKIRLDFYKKDESN